VRDFAKSPLAAMAVFGAGNTAWGQAQVAAPLARPAAALGAAHWASAHRKGSFWGDRFAALAAMRRAGPARQDVPAPPVQLPAGVTFLDYPDAAQTIVYGFNPGARTTKKAYFAGGYDTSLDGHSFKLPPQ
jgi:hypothetical protein